MGFIGFWNCSKEIAYYGIGDNVRMWEFRNFYNKIALISDNNEQITYKELEEEGNKLANIIGERCLVFSLCTNSIGSVIGYTGSLNHNIVPVLLNAKMDSESLENLMITYQPSYLWVPKDINQYFKECQEVFQSYNYVLLKTNYNCKVSMYRELGLLLTTSGSTGSPKLVRQSYTNILENAKSIVEYLELDDTERPITTLPMNYTYGLSIINSHLLVGATILLTDSKLMLKEFWQFFKDEKATSFGGVPYTYEMLAKLRFFRMDLPHLRYMTQAGGKLLPDLHRQYAEYAQNTNKKFIVMYGQTEATARMGYLPAEYSLKKYGSMGIAIPGGEFSIIDVDGTVIAEPERVGELVYEGPNVTMGYAQCIDDLAKGDEWNGKLHTGDMVKRDEEGFYYIVGRKKRFLKIYGNRVNLDEAERIIKDNFTEVDCACAGEDDHLSVYVTESDVQLHEKIKTCLSEKTKLNPGAFSIVYIEKIPKNEAGKTLYSDLK